MEQAFEEWMEDCEVPLPEEPNDRKIAVEALRLAFYAGWEAHGFAKGVVTRPVSH